MIPFAVEGVGSEIQGLHFGVGYDPAGWIGVLLEPLRTRGPVLVVVAATSLTTTSWLTSALAPPAG